MTQRLMVGLLGFLVTGLAQAESYELKLSKKSYQAGKTVSFIFYGNTTDWMKVSHWTVLGSQGKVVAMPLSSLLFTPVGPGKALPATGTWQWTQKDIIGKPVPSGAYTLQVSVMPALPLPVLKVKKQIQIKAPIGFGVSLTSDQPVYKRGSGIVTLTLTHESPATVHHTCSWKITQGVQVIREVNAKGWDLLKAGKPYSFSWDKRYSNGKLVPPGSYTITTEVVVEGKNPFTLSRTIALTPTGKLAGNSFFPLYCDDFDGGNRWVYQVANGSEEEMKIVGFGRLLKGTQVISSYRTVDNLLADRRIVTFSGNTLRVWTDGAWKDLFRFNRPKDHTYSVDLEPFLKEAKVRVGAKNVIVTTPAGTFTGCDRLDVMESTGSLYTYQSFWFAPGVGLIKYSLGSSQPLGGIKTYSLRRATIMGPGSKRYRIGLGTCGRAQFGS